jgi:tetratricopeptide (TPR) repeat protein
MAASRPFPGRSLAAGLIAFALFLPACGLAPLPVSGPVPEPEAASLAAGAALAPEAGNRAAAPPLYFLTGRVAALAPGAEAPALPDLLSASLPTPLPVPPADPARIADVPPPQLGQPLGGQRHLCGFDLTPALALALRSLAAGDPDQTLAALSASDRDPDNPAALSWQAALLRARAELSRGRPDLAEDAAQRAATLEAGLTGSDLLARAVRAEIRFQAGDLPRAMADAWSVAQALGTWTLPPGAPAQAMDDPRIGAAVLAQIQASSTLGGALLALGRAAEANAWLDAASRMENVLFSLGTRAETWAGYPLTPDLLAQRGLTLACLGAARMTQGLESESSFALAEHFFHAAQVTAGPPLAAAFRARGLFLSGKDEAAEQAALTARALAEGWDMMGLSWRLDTLRGQALARAGRESEAAEALRRAQRLADRLAGAVAPSAATARLGLDSRSLTLALSRLDESRDDWDFLFQDAERGRARSVADRLTLRRVGVGRQTEAVDRLRAMDREIIAERQRKMAGAGAAGSRERDLLYEREALLSALRGQDPELADLLGAQVLDLDAAKGSLPLDATLVFVLPVVPDEPLRALFITDDFIQLRQLPCTGSELSARLKEFAALRADRSQAGAQRAVLDGLKADLGLDTWGRTSALFVVPGGDVRLVPWGALDLPFPVAVLPSGGWLARQTLSLSPDPKFTLLADPDTAGLAPRLPNARAEAQALAQAVGGRALSGAQATEEALRALPADGSQVALLSAWVLPDPVNPLRTAVLLTREGRAAPLSAERLLEHPVGARVVALTASQTGLGLSGGLLARTPAGMDALERGFFLGGASTVLSTLWPVEDGASAFFVSAFATALRASTPGEAWLSARDAARKAGYAPAEYGAFVLSGSPGRVVPADYQNPPKGAAPGRKKSPAAPLGKLQAPAKNPSQIPGQTSAQAPVQTSAQARPKDETELADAPAFPTRLKTKARGQAVAGAAVAGVAASALKGATPDKAADTGAGAGEAQAVSSTPDKAKGASAKTDKSAAKGKKAKSAKAAKGKAKAKAKKDAAKGKGTAAKPTDGQKAGQE